MSGTRKRADGCSEQSPVMLRGAATGRGIAVAAGMVLGFIGWYPGVAQEVLPEAPLQPVPESAWSQGDVPGPPPMTDRIMQNWRMSVDHALETARQPLASGGWTTRPLHIDWFAGGFFGDSLMDGQGQLGNDAFGGLRLGYDCDDCWGIEARLAFAGSSAGDATGEMQFTGSNLTLVDFNALFYPWGDTCWRPFLTAGTGLAVLRLTDVDSSKERDVFAHFPFGLGLKYRWSRRLAFRMEFLDNLAVGGGRFGTLNNLSLTGGFEYRFGGEHPGYEPWGP